MAILQDIEFTQRDLALQYHFYSSHAWVKSPIQNIEELGIEEDEVQDMFMPAVETLLKINKAMTPG